MKAFSSSRWVYYVAIPATTFLLCFFSYHLGWKRGQDAQRRVARSKAQTVVPKEGVESNLTFYRTVKADRLPESSEKEVKSGSAGTKKAESQVRRPAIDSEKPKRQVTIPIHRVLVQVSAFRDVGRAHELTDRLMNLGYTAFTRSSEGKRGNWHRVFVGPVDSKAEAKKLSQGLEKEGFGPGFITLAESGE